MQINNEITNLKDETFYNFDYIQIIEDNIRYLKNINNLTVIEIENNLNYKYEGDFYGLLEEKNIPKDYHYACLRINDLKSSVDYKGDRDFIFIPNLSVIDSLKIKLNKKL